MIERLMVAQACRFCGHPAFAKDEEGPLHPCCKIWIGAWGHKTCPACARWLSLRNEKKTVRGRKVGTTVTRDEHRQRLLGRLRAAKGYWVPKSSLVQNASPEVDALVAELGQQGHKIVKRDSIAYPGESEYMIHE